MTMKILIAEERPTAFFYQIHIDDTKLVVAVPEQTAEVEVTPAVTDGAGNIIAPAVTEQRVVMPAVMGPNPLYLMEFSWGKDVSEENRKTEMRASCEQRLAELTPTVLADQGAEL